MPSISPSRVVGGTWVHGGTRHGFSQLTRPHPRVVIQRIPDGMPWFVRVSVRLRGAVSVRTVGAKKYGRMQARLTVIRSTTASSSRLSCSGAAPARCRTRPPSWPGAPPAPGAPAEPRRGRRAPPACEPGAPGGPGGRRRFAAAPAPALPTPRSRHRQPWEIQGEQGPPLGLNRRRAKTSSTPPSSRSPRTRTLAGCPGCRSAATCRPTLRGGSQA
jgi:hypothetical protein